MLAANRIIISTADGSHTVAIPDQDLMYHSRHGAILESMHVFIRAGLLEALQRVDTGTLQIFELGFGTGLNAFLTLLEADRQQRNIHYTAIEPFPLSTAEVERLNYPEQLGSPDLFQALHTSPWNQEVGLSDYFHWYKEQSDIATFRPATGFHLIYFDAFSPGAQPEIWTPEVMEQMYEFLLPGGILVTYCSKSEVRKAMQQAGFRVHKIQGPPGKREMVRAEKR